MYGTQAFTINLMLTIKFENDVNMYGTQAKILYMSFHTRLRLM